MSQPPTVRSTSGTAWTRSAVAMCIIVAAMWVLEIIDGFTNHALDVFGIDPRQIASLPKIFSAPFLHSGWMHLLSNTMPLFVLGILVLISGTRSFLWVTLIGTMSSGLLVWLISPSSTVTLGVSGVVFSYLFYLLIRGFYTCSWWQLVVAVLVCFAYGGTLWGVLPMSSGVSWQAHLGGAVGGVLAARLLHQRVSS